MSANARRDRSAFSGSLAIGALLTLALASGCSDKGTNPYLLEPIDAFVESQNLPKHQATRVLFQGPSADPIFFRVAYGDPQDCPSGCYFATAFGLQSGGRIGWIRIDDRRLLETRRLVFFDVAASDTILFAEPLWSDLEARQGWVYWAAFLPLLARDVDTPLPALASIAGQLGGYISPHIAWSLLQNPTVGASREVLSVLATLPVFQGDAYAAVRARARELLEEPESPGVVLRLLLSAPSGSRDRPVTAVAVVKKRGSERAEFRDGCCVVPPYIRIVDAAGGPVVEPPACDCLPGVHELGEEWVVSRFTWDGARNVGGQEEVAPGRYAVIATFPWRWPDREPPNAETLEEAAVVTWEGVGASIATMDP